MKSFNVPHRRLAFFACLVLAAVVDASATHAGTVYLNMVIDPPTTAGAGVPASSGFVVNSSRSGFGTWHLYAIDDAVGSAGIRSFFIKLNGTTPAINNRSPITQYDDDATFGAGDGPFNAGFNDVRTTTPIIGAGQGATNPNAVAGFGISAGNFSTVPGALSFNATTSGQWGNYAVGEGFISGIIPATGHLRNAVFLAEGTYTGAAPTVDITTPFANGGTGVNLWNATGFPNNGSFTVAAGTAQQLSNVGFFIPEPTTLALIGIACAGLEFRSRRRAS
jgi:hypothetical protein